jgi:hypothetical protein
MVYDTKEARFFCIVRPRNHKKISPQKHNLDLSVVIKSHQGFFLVFSGSSYGSLCYEGPEDSDAVMKIIRKSLGINVWDRTTKVIEIDEFNNTF